MRFTVSAKTYDLPHMEFSINVDNLTEAMRIARRLEDDFHEVSVIEGEVTGEVMYTRYQSIEIFFHLTTPEKAVFEAITEYRQHAEFFKNFHKTP